MSEKYKKANNKGYVWGSIILIVLIIGAFVISICQYCAGAVGYDELEQREYTFIKYSVTDGKYGGSIEIYVEEEKQPLLGAPNFVRKAVDEDVLKYAKSGDKITVWVSRASSLFCSYNVHEGKINGNYFLRLKDYQECHMANDIIGVVICSVLLFICLAGGGVFLVVCKKR